jgi:hypothetical protein
MIVLPTLIHRTTTDRKDFILARRSISNPNRRKKKRILRNTNKRIGKSTPPHTTPLHHSHSHSLPNLRTTPPTFVYPSNQSALFVQCNNNNTYDPYDWANQGPMRRANERANEESDDEDNPAQRVTELIHNSSLLQPRKKSLNALSQLSQRPSVTLLPFALRPLPMLKKIVEGKGRMNIATMRTKPRLTSTIPEPHEIKRQPVAPMYSQPCVPMELNAPYQPDRPVKRYKTKKKMKHNVSSSFAKIWYRDVPNGSLSSLLNRGRHFHFCKEKQRAGVVKTSKRGNKRVTGKFPSGFKKTNSSNAYYGATA